MHFLRYEHYESQEGVMESYNFAQDLLDTYQSLPDFLKLVWALVPPLFVLAMVWMIAGVIRSFAPQRRSQMSSAVVLAAPPTFMPPGHEPMLPPGASPRALPGEAKRPE